MERLRSCEAACELLEKYNMSYQMNTNWMDELDSKLKSLEELEAARAKEAWEKHVVSEPFSPFLFFFSLVQNLAYMKAKTAHRVSSKHPRYINLQMECGS